MLLPNKLFSYNESALSKLANVLKILDRPLSPSEILYKLEGVLNGPMELLDVLDVLYALGEIQLIEDEGKIVYAQRNKL